MSHRGFNNLYGRLAEEKLVGIDEAADLRSAITLCAELDCEGAQEELAILRQHIFELREEIQKKSDLIWAVCKDSSGNKVLRQEINMAYEIYKRELQNEQL